MKTKIYKLAPIIRAAANKYLYHPNKTFHIDICTSEYSCCAVENYICDKFGYGASDEILDAFHNFAKAKGCPTGSLTAFSKYYKKEEYHEFYGTYNSESCTDKSQDIRYAWLHLLADVAEEENIEIKV